MADMDKDRLKELEIESILEETHYLADQERMEQTAQKYRAKPKIEEIFSNADKKPRLKNTNPLDESEPDTSNSIVGDKTAATMQAELIMDGNDDDLVTPEQLKAEAEKKAAEKAEKAKREYEEAKKKAAEEENKIVTLTPEYDENTEFSGEVLGEVDQFRDEAEIKSYHTIDIDIPEDKPKEKTETKVAILSPSFKSILPFKASPIFSTVPNNIPPDPVTGLRCFPCFATMSIMISAIFALSPPACCSIWVKLAESIFNV